MDELVYSLKQVFSLDQRDGALGQTEAVCYFIAPYQRGYKWASFSENDPVCILMTDLADAFSNRSDEYYLQYITLHKADRNGTSVLEVIDGQQRLTTITLIFSVLACRLPEDGAAIINGLLSYEVRPVVSEFFRQFIYGDTKKLLNYEWRDLVTDHPSYDEQDIYYLFQACKAIDKALPELVREFKNYLHEHVKIILNRVEKHSGSERIFTNLNTNKVELTEADLVKALLLTLSAREKIKYQTNPRYREIVEERAFLGKQWDDIVMWINQPDIRNYYFFESEKPVEDFLFLLAIRNGMSQQNQGGKHATFNFLQSLIRRKQKSAHDLFEEFRKIKSVLQNWWSDKEIYNLIGFILSAKDSKKRLSDFAQHIEKTQPELRILMRDIARTMLPANFEECEYGQDNTEIHRLLLALSVFNNNERFDFGAYKKEVWSLEHIFPQNPKSFPRILKAGDLILLNSLLVERANRNAVEISDELRHRLNQDSCELAEEEVELICDALKTDKLNSIGNMALLTRSDNSSNGNGMFDKKRINMVRRISNGSFVPKHTYDVFSKLLSVQMTPDLGVWTELDINAHKKWIKDRMDNLIPKN